MALNCTTCTTPLEARWDGRLVCCRCQGVSFAHAEEPRVSRYAIETVRRIERVAIERGWTLGELWSVVGYRPAWGLVCFVRAPWTHVDGKRQTLVDGDKIAAIDGRRIALSRINGHGASVAAFYRSPVAAAIPVERLTCRPRPTVDHESPREGTQQPAGRDCNRNPGNGEGVTPERPAEGQHGAREVRHG